jgi:TPR repeat protein
MRQPQVKTYRHLVPESLPKDDREAARLFRLEANREDAQAHFIRALFYECGRCGLPKDEREAVRLYRLAADQGRAGAQRGLAFFYADRRGSVPDGESAAARLYKLAADQGHADALYWLASFYEEGRGGLQKDYREATRLYKLAADQGIQWRNPISRASWAKPENAPKKLKPMRDATSASFRRTRETIHGGRLREILLRRSS